MDDCAKEQEKFDGPVSDIDNEGLQQSEKALEPGSGMHQHDKHGFPRVVKL